MQRANLGNFMSVGRKGSGLAKVSVVWGLQMNLVDLGNPRRLFARDVRSERTQGAGVGVSANCANARFFLFRLINTDKHIISILPLQKP